MKITLTIDIPGINPESARAREILNAIEFAWDHSNTWANLGSTSTLISQWWFVVEGGETRHMPEPEPHGSRDTFVPHPNESVNLELKAALLRFWINEPILRHAMLLYREACTSDTSVKISKDVQQDIKILHKMAADVCGLPKD